MCLGNLQGTASIVANPLQLYESSGDTEAYSIYSLLASVNGVSSSYLLSEVLSALVLLNLFMQKKIADTVSWSVCCMTFDSDAYIKTCVVESKLSIQWQLILPVCIK